MVYSQAKYKKTPAKGAYAAAAKAKLSTAKGMERWWSSLRGDPAFIHAWKPDGLALHVDDPNGRFRFTYCGSAPRSVSWTERGMESACIEVLKIAWTMHYKRTGAVCPIPLS